MCGARTVALPPAKPDERCEDGKVRQRFIQEDRVEALVGLQAEQPEHDTDDHEHSDVSH